MRNHSLAISLEIYGERHPSVATSYNNIGEAWRALGDPKQAIAFYEKSLAIFLEVYGERHPSLATTYNNLAYVYRQSGEPEKAAYYTAKAKGAW
ncbi:tetratricopeptide repeat protein [Candidatus Magnetobacterium casense]|uniref:Tetratricopeptide repeat protein n=1 Tax=Candidatus Magnetobacterium casense TaxID=1455061 RepID=A0ABS6S418_9BACT|nr:tetratricopeptide repeat protein [Candidatus Magnetobacterium casensis]MBV6343345.1 tetratricopeptide repeat protein [Candidatus Magnetobacterium casensis]